jgi:hypothetical protein
MPYTVKLLGMKCLAAQEEDGDEIEIKFNNRVIWNGERVHVRLHERPANSQTVDEIDFAGGRMHNPASGWSALPGFQDGAFTFSGLEGVSRFELHEEDMGWFGGDDYLGSAPVSERDAGHGKISIVFAKDGANYILYYEVSA